MGIPLYGAKAKHKGQSILGQKKFNWEELINDEKPQEPHFSKI
jgi:hypothetical protein